MKNLSLTLGLWVLGAAMCVAEPIELNLSSPEGTHKVKFYEKKSASGANVLCYEVNYNGKQVVKESQAGLQLDRRPDCNWTIVSGKWLWGCVNCLSRHAGWTIWR